MKDTTSLINTVQEGIKLGNLPSDYVNSYDYKKALLKSAINDGLITPREDGAGFKVRTKFSFADTVQGQKKVLEDEYGAGNAYKIGDRWLVRDKNGYNYVDEKGLSFKDVSADIFGDLPELIGATTGGLIGFGAGGVGSVAGASVGGGLGDGVKKLIAKVLGVQDNQSAPDILKDMGDSALISGLGQGAGVLVGKIASKALSPNASKFTQDAKDRKTLADIYNINLTPADILQTPSMYRIENTLNSGFTGDKIADFKGKQFLTLQDYLANLKNDITGGKSIAEAGEAIQNKMNQTKIAKKAEFDKQYGDLYQLAGEQPIGLNNLLNQAESIMFENSKLPKSMQTGNSIANDIIDLFKGKDGADYDTFVKMRSNLGDLSSSAKVTGDINLANYKRLKGAMEKDFDEYAKVNNVVDEKRAIDKDYQKYKEAFESQPVKGIIGSDTNIGADAEKIPGMILQKGADTRLDRALYATSDTAPIKQGYGNILFDSSKVSNPSIDSPFANYYSTAKLNTTQQKIGDVATNSLLNPSEIKTLGDLINLGNITNLSKTAYGNPSGTSKALEGAITGGAMLMSPYGIAYPLGKYALTNYYLSDFGKKHLTEGLLGDVATDSLMKRLGTSATSGANLIFQKNPTEDELMKGFGIVGVKGANSINGDN